MRKRLLSLVAVLGLVAGLAVLPATPAGAESPVWAGNVTVTANVNFNAVPCSYPNCGGTYTGTMTASVSGLDLTPWNVEFSLPVSGNVSGGTQSLACPLLDGGVVLSDMFFGFPIVGFYGTEPVLAVSGYFQLNAHPTILVGNMFYGLTLHTASGSHKVMDLSIAPGVATMVYNPIPACDGSPGSAILVGDFVSPNT